MCWWMPLNVYCIDGYIMLFSYCLKLYTLKLFVSGIFHDNIGWKLEKMNDSDYDRIHSLCSYISGLDYAKTLQHIPFFYQIFFNLDPLN